MSRVVFWASVMAITFASLAVGALANVFLWNALVAIAAVLVLIAFRLRDAGKSSWLALIPTGFALLPVPVSLAYAELLLCQHCTSDGLWVFFLAMFAQTLGLVVATIFGFWAGLLKTTKRAE